MQTDLLKKLIIICFMLFLIPIKASALLTALTEEESNFIEGSSWEVTYYTGSVYVTQYFIVGRVSSYSLYVFQDVITSMLGTGYVYKDEDTGNMVFYFIHDEFNINYRLDFNLIDGTGTYSTTTPYNEWSATFTRLDSCETTTPDPCPTCPAGFTQSDLDAEYTTGYNKGLADGKAQQTPCVQLPVVDSVTINTDLSFKIDNAVYSSLLGDSDIWVEFEFYDTQNGKMLWELIDFGAK